MRFSWGPKSGQLVDIWMFPKIGYPQIIHFNRVFHYKPSILGYPYFWKHPYVYICIPRTQLSSFLGGWPEPFYGDKKPCKIWGVDASFGLLSSYIPGIFLNLRISDWTLQWKGEWTCMMQGCIGPQNDASFEGSGYLGNKTLWVIYIFWVILLLGVGNQKIWWPKPRFGNRKNISI